MTEHQDTVAPTITIRTDNSLITTPRFTIQWPLLLSFLRFSRNLLAVKN